jgi:hypothetical protein
MKIIFKKFLANLEAKSQSAASHNLELGRIIEQAAKQDADTLKNALNILILRRPNIAFDGDMWRDIVKAAALTGVDAMRVVLEIVEQMRPEVIFHDSDWFDILQHAALKDYDTLNLAFSKCPEVILSSSGQ